MVLQQGPDPGTAGSSGTSESVTSVRSRGEWKNRLRLLRLFLQLLLLLHSQSNFCPPGGSWRSSGPPPAAQLPSQVSSNCVTSLVVLRSKALALIFRRSKVKSL